MTADSFPPQHPQATSEDDLALFEAATALEARLTALLAPDCLPPTEDVLERLLSRADALLTLLRASASEEDEARELRRFHIDALVSAALSLHAMQAPSAPEDRPQRPSAPKETRSVPRPPMRRKPPISRTQRLSALSATFVLVAAMTVTFHWNRARAAAPAQRRLQVIDTNASPQAKARAKMNARMQGQRVLSIPDGPTLILPAAPQRNPSKEHAELNP